jgi:hypothetical protein
LRNEPGVEVEVVDGSKGELSVFVDGVPLIQRGSDNLPSTEEVEAAVRNAVPAGA